MTELKVARNELLAKLQERKDALPPNLKAVYRRVKGRENKETEYNWDNWSDSSSF